MMLMLTITLLAVMAAEAAVVINARTALVQTRTQSQVIALFTGDLPTGTLSIDPRPLMLSPQVIESTSASRLPSASGLEMTSLASSLGGGTSSEPFSSFALTGGPPTSGALVLNVPNARLASLELPQILPYIEGRTTAPQADVIPPTAPVPIEKSSIGTLDQTLALLAPAPLAGLAPAVGPNAQPEPPMLEPFMEVFEDWVTRTPMNRHPGFHKVHFAPNVQGRCLPKTLLNVLYDVGLKFGDVKVISGYRSPSHNRAVGGATRSMHVECRAIDFFVAGSGSGIVDWLIRRQEVGGYKRYPFGSFHIDNVPRRTWAWGKKKKKRRR